MLRDRLVRPVMLVAAIVLPIARHARAQIEGKSELTINFINAQDASTKAIWIDPLGVTDKGLGWEGDENSSRDGWIITQPLAIGLSWRPARGASVQLAVEPRTHGFKLPNGEIVDSVNQGSGYTRYSADGNTWSDWQELPAVNNDRWASPRNRPSDDQRFFSGEIAVPRIEQAEYEHYFLQFRSLNVPWKSDEEATANWIMEKEPSFFQKHKSFVGYLQFLFEADFYGGQRIDRFLADVRWGVGGKFSPPKNEKDFQNRQVPWGFRSRTPSTHPALASPK